MTHTVVLHGGPLDDQSVEVSSIEPLGYGGLVGRGASPGDVAYKPDRSGRWTWQGRPDWPDSGTPAISPVGRTAVRNNPCVPKTSKFSAITALDSLLEDLGVGEARRRQLGMDRGELDGALARNALPGAACSGSWGRRR